MNNLALKFSKNKKMPSLVGSVTRTLSLALIIAFVLMGILFNYYGSKYLQSVTNERLNYILTSQSNVSAQLLWDLEIDRIQLALKNIVKDSNISAARISETSNSKTTVMEQYNWDSKPDNSLIMKRDIVFNSEDGSQRTLGTLEIAVDYTTIEKQISLIMWISGIIFGSIFILMNATILFFLKRDIEPITALSDSLVDADYFTHTIEKIPSKTREINDLFDAVITMQNIMQRQTREIQDQKAMLNTIIDKMPLGMFVEDIHQNNKLILVNDMFKTLMGIENINCIGKNLSELIFEKDAHYLTNLNKELDSKSGVLDIDSHEISTSYGNFIAHILKAPIYDDRGNVSLIVSMVEDVTEQVKAKNEIIDAKLTAEKASFAKSEFLANMSHELRTPMNSIIGLTRMIIDDGHINEEQKEMLGTIEKSSNILLEIVNDILDISKIEAESLFLENIPFDLKETLGAVLSTMKPLASAKSLGLEANWKSKMNPIVLGDPTRFSRIIINLAGNAIKFTETGFIHIEFDIIPKGQQAILFQLQVSDTGIGIPQDKLEKIFDKFSQADDSTTRRFGGTGLGLTITKQLIDLMGGTINVTSTIGKGTTFTVQIPFEFTTHEILEQQQIITNNPSIMDKEAKTKRKPIGEIRVLVAEDHMMNQMMIQKLLPRLGIQKFDIANDGKIAIDMFNHEKYDLVIMDCHMPNINGYDAATRIRQEESEKDADDRVPIIAMTADAMVGTKEKCLQAGMDEYISKPVNSDELVSILNRWFVSAT